MRARLILHGAKAAAREDDVRAALEAVRGRGAEIDVRATFEAGDARALAHEAVRLGATRVVAGGGDGTLNEVASGLLDLADAGEAELGILPLGTGNDFARAAGIPLDDLTEALRIAVEGPARPADVGRLGGNAFLNVASGGAGTQVTVETPEAMKNALGAAAYLLTGLRTFTSIEATVARFVAEDLDERVAFLALAVGNGRCAGGGHVLCPDATVDDGLLDVTVVTDPPAGSRMAVAANLLRKGLDEIPEVRRFRVASLTVEAEGGMYVNLDGEPVQGERFEFRVDPGALALVLPAASPLRAPSG